MNPFRAPQPTSGRGSSSPLAAVPSVKEGESSVSLRLYEPIDSWGGDWGVSAKEFVAAVDAIPDDTKEIRLLINSPGGEVWDGLAILNALRSHPARVVAVVEGIAASAASFIAAGVDELVMMRNSELFIHNAWGFAMGDAEEMRAAAGDLEHLDRNLAAIYSQKSGDSVDFWLAEMGKDRWLSAEEAVEAKLANRIEGDGDAKSAKARFDLSVFARRGEHAPAAALAGDKHPSSAEPGEPNQEGTVMAYDDLKAGLCERLGVTDADAADETLLAALDEALQEQADENTDPAPEPAAAALPEGVVPIDAEALAQLRADAAAGREARAEQHRVRREGIVTAAIKAGKVPPKSRQRWLDALEKDEAGTVGILADLEPNTIPVDEIGEMPSGELSSDDYVYAVLFGDDDVTKKGAHRG